MNCRSAESLYSAFLEEELSQEERRSMEAHLMGCRRCSVAVKELKQTLVLMSALPSVTTSPHFEEEIFDRIRSGEALRPTLVEWLGGFFTAERLRPVFVGGAAVCALWIAVIVTRPGNFVPGNGSVANREAGSPNASSTDAGTLASSGSAAMTAEDGSEPASGSQTPVFGPRAAFATEPSAVARRTTPSRASSEDQWANRKAPATEGSDSALAPGGRFQDEYILDQYYLDRGSERAPSIVPVSGDATDDVYITF